MSQHLFSFFLSLLTFPRDSSVLCCHRILVIELHGELISLPPSFQFILALSLTAQCTLCLLPLFILFHDGRFLQLHRLARLTPAQVPLCSDYKPSPPSPLLPRRVITLRCAEVTPCKGNKKNFLQCRKSEFFFLCEERCYQAGDNMYYNHLHTGWICSAESFYTNPLSGKMLGAPPLHHYLLASLANSPKALSR